MAFRALMTTFIVTVDSVGPSVDSVAVIVDTNRCIECEWIPRRVFQALGGFVMGNPKPRVLYILLSLALFVSSGCANQARYRSSCPCGPDWMSEGLRCALAPQEFAGADFRPACRDHDLGYEVPGKPKKQTDDEFLEANLVACECSSAPCLCRATAHMLYLNVHLFGWLSYWQSQS